MESREDTLNRKQSVWSSPAGYTWEGEQCILYLFHLVSICRKSPKGSTQVRNVVAFTRTPFKSKRISLLVTSTDFLHFNFFSSCRGIICLLAWQRQCWRLSISSFGNRTQILQGVPLRSALTISHYLSLRTEATVIQCQVERCCFFNIFYWDKKPAVFVSDGQPIFHCKEAGRPVLGGRSWALSEISMSSCRLQTLSLQLGLIDFPPIKQRSCRKSLEQSVWMPSHVGQAAFKNGLKWRGMIVA